MMAATLQAPPTITATTMWPGIWSRPQVAAAVVPTRLDLERGLENGEFFAQYQPKVSMATGELVGVEALLRWKHPRLWATSPEKIITLAEESGLIHKLGMHMITTACDQLVQWAEEGKKPIHVAVNVSVKQLAQEGFSSAVIGLLLSHGIPPHLLTIEITESAELKDAVACVNAISQLKEFGIRISLDDFGTGFSSMAYLKMFQVDEIKIDRSFIKDIVSSEKDQAIVEATLALGKSLDLSVVAEGIENWRQQRCLMRMGCTIGQGYLYGKPMLAGKLALGTGGA